MNVESLFPARDQPAGRCIIVYKEDRVIECSLGRIWEENKDYLFRMLLSLTRDVDLAEDCLQDTYIRASSGFSGFRGGSASAWLAAIARNVFYGHARRKGFRSEESLETAAEQADPSSHVGSDAHFELIEVHDAVSALSSDLRKALIMKHYGDWGYDEIGRHLACTPAVAKHRVWRAMQKIRLRIGAAQDGADCSELGGQRGLDWLYGGLSPRKSRQIEAHAKLCPTCRQGMADMRKLAAALDDAEQDRRIHTLIDIDDHGVTTRYVWSKYINRNQKLQTMFRWGRRPGWVLEYLALQGQPVEFRLLGRTKERPDCEAFEGRLPTPVPLGQMVDGMFVIRTPEQSLWNAQAVGEGLWHYHHKHSPFPDHEGLFVVTIRLPEGARLLNADPAPRTSVTRAGRLSLNWQVITPITHNQVSEEDAHLPDTPYQFQAHLDYRLGCRDQL